MSNDIKSVIAETITDCVNHAMTIDQMEIVLEDHVECEWRDNDNIENYENRYSSFHEALGKMLHETEDSITKDSIRMLRFVFSLRPFEDLYILPSLESTGRFSYSRNVDDNDARRVVTKFGRIIRRQLLLGTTVIRDDIIAKILDLLTQQLWTDINSIVVHDGGGVHQAYEYFTSEISCMSGCCYHDDWIEIYSCNKCVRCLAVYDEDNENRCVAKALLWKADSGHLLLDRVYCTDDRRPAAMAIIAKARDMGAEVPENSFTRYSGEETLTLDITDICAVPYFDSFRYVSGHSIVDDRTLVHLSTYDGNCILDSTEGEGISRCRKCGTNNVACCDDYCFNCRTRLNATQCAICGNYSNCYYMDEGYVCDSCRDELYYSCYSCDTSCKREDSSVTTVNGKTICHNCIEQYYRKCDECGEFHHINNGNTITSDEDTQIVCNQCRNTRFSNCGRCNRTMSINKLNLSVTTADLGVMVCYDCNDFLRRNGCLK